MRDWSKEPYVKLYSRESLEKWLWPLFQRGLRDYLLRFADEDGTLIVIVSGEADPVGALLRGLGAHPDEIQPARGFVERLLADGFLRLEADRIRIVNFEVAQAGVAREDIGRSPGAIRSRRYRRRRSARIFARDGWRCRYCGSRTRLSIDHIEPRCRGGSDAVENLATACLACNCRKGGRTPAEAGMVLQ